jgi:hypothetical protein
LFTCETRDRQRSSILPQDQENVSQIRPAPAPKKKKKKKKVENDFGEGDEGWVGTYGGFLTDTSLSSGFEILLPLHFCFGSLFIPNSSF